MRFVLAAFALCAFALGACTKHNRAPSQAAAAQLAPPPSTDEAFAIAYPNRNVALTMDGKVAHLRFSPLGLYQVDADTFALVSAGENLDGDCHACAGAVSISYLGRYPALTREAQPVVFPSGGWGRPADVSLGPPLSSAPVLLLQTTDSDYGITQNTAVVVRLGPRAADVRAVGSLQLDYDNSATGFEPSCAIQGRIRAGEPDKSFSVEYTGSLDRTIAYRWIGDAWRPDAVFSPEEYCANRHPAASLAEVASTADTPNPAGMGPAEVDRLTTDAVLLGRAIGCHLDVDVESRRVGDWLDRVAPPGSRDQQIYLPMLMAGMRQNAEAQAAGRSPDSCEAVTLAVRRHRWP